MEYIETTLYVLGIVWTGSFIAGLILPVNVVKGIELLDTSFIDTDYWLQDKLLWLGYMLVVSFIWPTLLSNKLVELTKKG